MSLTVVRKIDYGGGEARVKVGRQVRAAALLQLGEGGNQAWGG